MDFSHPGLFISGVLIGLAGLAVFMYGKRGLNLKCMGIGLGLAIFPYFVHSLLVMWLIAAVAAAGLCLLPSGE